jgi:NADP-dependent 3-hydroxy acid dehydrogenase YdfG
MSIAGRKILITGGSRGLGAALAGRLHEAGAEVWIAARRSDDLQDIAKQLASNHAPVRWSRCDVTDNNNVTALVHEVRQAWGSLDVLINNAGVWIEGPITENDPEAIHNLLNVNVLGPILVTRGFLPVLLETGNAKVVNIGSLAAIEPGPLWPIYTASKYALRGLSESLEQAFQEQSINFSIINPGGIDTELYAAAGLSEKRHEPWMMTTDSVASIIVNILESPPDASIDRMDIRKVAFEAG